MKARKKRKLISKVLSQRGKKVRFNGKKVTVYSALTNRRLINVSSFLKDPKEFHGNPKVHHVVCFNNLLTELIGKYDGRFGHWDVNDLPKQGIIILEYYQQEAKRLIEEINSLAQKIIANPKLYDDKNFCKEYFLRAKDGYQMLKKYEDKFNVGDQDSIPISIERAGLVTTRLALDKNRNEKIPKEIRVVTKRTHLINRPETNLAVTVKWRNTKKLSSFDRQKVLLSDFVNPASGASTAAFLIAALVKGVKPQIVHHRSISLTKQGTLFLKKALEEMGIKTTFYSVGVCDELNSNYYLIGNRTVADAGRVLRHFLPDGYRH